MEWLPEGALIGAMVARWPGGQGWKGLDARGKQEGTKEKEHGRDTQWSRAGEEGGPLPLK